MGWTNIIYTYYFIYFLNLYLYEAIAYHCPIAYVLSLSQPRPYMHERAGAGQAGPFPCMHVQPALFSFGPDCLPARDTPGRIPSS
jgi:hypothetical protein